LFALLLVLNILWFSVADSRMCLFYPYCKVYKIHTAIDGTLYVMRRIYNR